MFKINMAEELLLRVRIHYCAKEHHQKELPKSYIKSFLIFTAGNTQFDFNLSYMCAISVFYCIDWHVLKLPVVTFRFII